MHRVDLFYHPSKSLGNKLAPEADAEYLDVLVVLIHVLDEATQERNPRLIAVDRDRGPRDDDRTHAFELLLTRKLEIKNVVVHPYL